MSGDPLTVEQEFAVRELRVWGLEAARIAELLDVSESAVSRAARGGAAAPDVDDVDDDADDGDVVAEVVEAASPSSWPPPVDEATRWHEFTPRDARKPVRARQVPLWGRLVWSAEVDGAVRVWCPCCRRFLSLEVLGRPFNGHPVGVPTPSGTIVSFDPGDDGPMPSARPGFRDLMREPW